MFYVDPLHLMNSIGENCVCFVCLACVFYSLLFCICFSLVFSLVCFNSVLLCIVLKFGLIEYLLGMCQHLQLSYVFVC